MDKETVEFIPLCVPEIRGNEWEYIKECLDTGWVSSVGSFVDRFEDEFAHLVGVKHAIATSSGTAALHVALHVAGVKPEDEVLVSSMTFIASANAVRYVGAWPVFVDADPKYWQMDVQRVDDFIKTSCQWQEGQLKNKITGRYISAIMPVHILGHPVDMTPLMEIARKYNLVVVEDATESLGAKYKGQPTGGMGDIACFSFNGNKIITTGGGGMIVTYREDWAQKVKYLTTQAKDHAIEYIHEEVGYNYRLPNLQSAMGCAQLEQLNNYVTIKRNIASTYTKALDDVPGLTFMAEAEWAFNTYWMYTLLVDESVLGFGSRDLLRKLESERIQTRPLWQPMHLSPAHKNAPSTDCSVAEKLYKEALSLPCSVGLGDAQLRVIEVLRQTFNVLS